MILPRKKVSISTSGVIYGACITLDQRYSEGWLHRSKEVTHTGSQAAYDPSCVDKIYLFPKHDSTIYWNVLYQPKVVNLRYVILASVGDTRSKRKNLHAIEKIIANCRRVGSIYS